MKKITNIILLICISCMSFPTMAKSLSLSDALQLTLEKSPEIIIQKREIMAKKGEYYQEAGAFDLNFESGINYQHEKSPILNSEILPGFDEMRTDATTLNVGLNKQLKNGIIFGLQSEASRLNTRFKDATGLASENRAGVDFVINIPLLKGKKVGKSLDANGQLYLAQAYLFKHGVSQEVLNTIIAYWQCIFQQNVIEVRLRAKQRAERLVSALRKLIKADERPKTDIYLSLANLADRKAELIASRQDLIAAKEHLADVMGITYNDSKAIDLFTGKFPSSNVIPKMKSYKSSFLNRQDYLAAKAKVNAERLLFQRDNNDLKSTLNLNLAVGYEGLHEGKNIHKAFSDNIAGPSAMAGIEYKVPVENRTARGVLLEQNARYIQAITVMKDLNRKIQLEIALSHSAIQHSLAQMSKAKLAVDNYQEAIGNETTKLKTGNATLIDIISVGDQLVNARLSYLESQLSYATVRAQFKFDTGRLVSFSKDGTSHVNVM